MMLTFLAVPVSWGISVFPDTPHWPWSAVITYFEIKNFLNISVFTIQTMLLFHNLIRCLYAVRIISPIHKSCGIRVL